MTSSLLEDKDGPTPERKHLAGERSSDGPGRALGGYSSATGSLAGTREEAPILGAPQIGKKTETTSLPTRKTQTQQHPALLPVERGNATARNRIPERLGISQEKRRKEIMTRGEKDP